MNHNISSDGSRRVKERVKMINEALSLSCQGAQVSYSGLFSQVTQQRKRLLRLQERVDSFDRQLEFLHRQRVSDLVASGGKGTSVGAGDECFVDQVMAELEKARNDRSEMQGKLDKFEAENDRLKELLGYALSELEQANHTEEPVSAVFEARSSQEQTQTGANIDHGLEFQLSYGSKVFGANYCNNDDKEEDIYHPHSGLDSMASPIDIELCSHELHEIGPLTAGGTSLQPLVLSEYSIITEEDEECDVLMILTGDDDEDREVSTDWSKEQRGPSRQWGDSPVFTRVTTIRAEEPMPTTPMSLALANYRSPLSLSRRHAERGDPLDDDGDGELLLFSSSNRSEGGMTGLLRSRRSWPETKGLMVVPPPPPPPLLFGPRVSSNRRHLVGELYPYTSNRRVNNNNSSNKKKKKKTDERKDKEEEDPRKRFDTNQELLLALQHIERKADGRFQLPSEEEEAEEEEEEYDDEEEDSGDFVTSLGDDTPPPLTADDANWCPSFTLESRVLTEASEEDEDYDGEPQLLRESIRQRLWLTRIGKTRVETNAEAAAAAAEEEEEEEEEPSLLELGQGGGGSSGSDFWVLRPSETKYHVIKESFWRNPLSEAYYTSSSSRSIGGGGGGDDDDDDDDVLVHHSYDRVKVEEEEEEVKVDRKRGDKRSSTPVPFSSSSPVTSSMVSGTPATMAKTPSTATSHTISVGTDGCCSWTGPARLEHMEGQEEGEQQGGGFVHPPGSDGVTAEEGGGHDDDDDDDDRDREVPVWPVTTAEVRRRKSRLLLASFLSGESLSTKLLRCMDDALDTPTSAFVAAANQHAPDDHPQDYHELGPESSFFDDRDGDDSE